jgi:hypothetical protein
MCVLLIEDDHRTTGGGAAVRAAGGDSRKRREAAAEEPILSWHTAKLEGPPALISRHAARQHGTSRAEPLQRRGLGATPPRAAIRYRSLVIGRLRLDGEEAGSELA